MQACAVIHSWINHFERKSAAEMEGEGKQHF